MGQTLPQRSILSDLPGFEEYFRKCLVSSIIVEGCAARHCKKHPRKTFRNVLVSYGNHNFTIVDGDRAFQYPVWRLGDVSFTGEPLRRMVEFMIISDKDAETQVRQVKQSQSLEDPGTH